MFKQFLSLILVFFFFIVQANASTSLGLKAAFDELNYALTVEWNQKDLKFYNKQVLLYKVAIHKLQSEGMSNTALINETAILMKNTKLADELKLTLKSIDLSKLSNEEVGIILMQSYSKTYADGSSWNGEATLAVALLVPFFVLIAVLVNRTFKDDSGSSWEDPNCAYWVNDMCADDWDDSWEN